MAERVFRVFKYRLYPSRSQAKNLERVLTACHHLYNMVLAERKYVWELEKRYVSNQELEALAKHYRAAFPYAQQMYSQTAQSVVKQVDEAFQGFFRRVKNGEKAGYPRFKGHHRFHSFEFKQYGFGAKLDGKRLKLYGIGRVRVRWHRPLEGGIKTVRIKRSAGQWYVCFTCETEAPKPLPKTGEDVGVDVGITALIATSKGDKVDNPQHYRAGQAQLRILQRSVQRKDKGGNNRKKALLAVQRQHQHVANQRRDFLNKLVFRLVKYYDRIAVEDLKIRNMVCNKHLSKSILDSGWGYFKENLMVKAADAGRLVALINPAYTSQDCCNCGYRFDEQKLSDRWFACPNPACGLSLDRDHNAAINILKKSGWVTTVGANVVGSQTHALPRSPRL